MPQKVLIIFEKVTFRNRGKAHYGLRLVAACRCPGSQNGRLTNGAVIVCDGWEKASCGGLATKS